MRVERGDSLWTIATERLPLGATDREIQEASAVIADASRIPRDARLRVGQVLVVPPAVGRLADRVRARPLVTLAPTWRRPVRTRDRPAAITELAGVKVRRAEVMRFQGLRNDALHPDALTTLEIGFAPMSKATFDHLHDAFGHRSRVTYRRSRSYSVVDFLPPIVQALVDLDIEVPVAQTLAGTAGWSPRFPDRPKEVSLDPNCHGTAYELVREYRSPQDVVSVYFGDMLALDTIVRGETKRFRAVGAAGEGRLDRIPKLALRPGDLVQFYEVTDWARPTLLLHSAVHVGCGIYFDKPNTELVGEDSPYRLGTFETIAAPVLQSVEQHARVEVHRLVRPLAPPLEAFASGFAEQLHTLETRAGRAIGAQVVQMLELGAAGGILDEQLSALVEFPLAFDNDGRALPLAR